jgi:23S rRNA (cytosine1962-C5)-methyltransferase
VTRPVADAYDRRMDPADAYELLDAGAGRRLERFGALVLDRPAPGATAPPRRDPTAWGAASARFERRPGASEGGWTSAEAIPERWTIAIEGVSLELRPTPAGQVGLFPEHRDVARWAGDQAIAAGRTLGRPAAVLNLFAYTGLATLLLARAGAHVAHVDASRPAVAWARRNAALSGLEDRPIRWLVEDAARFVAREVRRRRRYDGVVLDPPTYGHGPGGAAWRLEDDLGPLLAGIRPLLAGAATFVACTAHATGLAPDVLDRLLREGLDLGSRPIDVRELVLVAASGARLPTGWAALLGADGGGESR